MSSLADELQTLPGTSISVVMPRTARCPGWWHPIPGEGCRYPGALHAATRAGNTSAHRSTRAGNQKREHPWQGEGLSLASVFRKSEWFPTPARPESPVSYSPVLQKATRAGSHQTSHGCSAARSSHCCFFLPPLTIHGDARVTTQPDHKNPTYRSVRGCANSNKTF